MTPDEVRAEVGRMSAMAEDESRHRFGFPGTAAPPVGASWHAEALAVHNELNRLLDDHPTLEARGYGWARHLDSYGCTVELVYQLHVLQMLAHVPWTTGAWHHDRPIVVSVVRNRDFSLFARRGHRVDVVFLPMGYMYFLRGFARLNSRLRKLGEQLAPPDRAPERHWSTDLGGHFVSLALEAAAPVARIYLSAFQANLSEAMAGTYPVGPQILPPLESEEPSLTNEMVVPTETFLIAHECAHLLLGHTSAGRDIETELKADTGATVLLRGMTETNLLVGAAAMIIGAPTAFVLARLYFDIVETMLDTHVRGHDLAQEFFREVEDELALRARVHVACMAKLGLGSFRSNISEITVQLRRLATACMANRAGVLS